ncbi:Far1 [Hordeum vulgare]|nr:Far1 [Hordeum vulgare]
MAGSRTSDEGSDACEQPSAGVTAASPPLPGVTAPLPTASAPPATAPLHLTVAPLGFASDDAASSSAEPPPWIHAVKMSAHIDFKLDAVCRNYSKWRRIMSFILCKLGVESHVLVNLDPHTQTAQWRHDDLQILLMIYGTITDKLYDVLSAQDSTAYHAWFLLGAFFRHNLAGRAIHVGAEFRAMVHGDMEIAEYYRRLKALTDSLYDLDEHVTDKTLTLHLIRGLAPWFSVMASLLPMQVHVRGNQPGRPCSHGGHHCPHRHPWRLLWLRFLWFRQLQREWRRSASTGGVIQRQPDCSSDRGGHSRGRGRGSREHGGNFLGSHTVDSYRAIINLVGSPSLMVNGTILTLEHVMQRLDAIENKIAIVELIEGLDRKIHNQISQYESKVGNFLKNLKEKELIVNDSSRIGKLEDVITNLGSAFAAV